MFGSLVGFRSSERRRWQWQFGNSLLLLLVWGILWMLFRHVRVLCGLLLRWMLIVAVMDSAGIDLGEFRWYTGRSNISWRKIWVCDCDFDTGWMVPSVWRMQEKDIEKTWTKYRAFVETFALLWHVVGQLWGESCWLLSRMNSSLFQPMRSCKSAGDWLGQSRTQHDRFRLIEPLKSQVFTLIGLCRIHVL